MILPVSARPKKIVFRLDPNGPHNAVRLYLPFGVSLTVDPNKRRGDLLPVSDLPTSLLAEYLTALTTGKGGRSKLKGDEAFTVSFFLNERRHYQIGMKPLVEAHLEDRFLQVFLVQDEIVDAQHVYEPTVAS